MAVAPWLSEKTAVKVTEFPLPLAGDSESAVGAGVGALVAEIPNPATHPTLPPMLEAWMGDLRVRSSELDCPPATKPPATKTAIAFAESEPAPPYREENVSAFPAGFN